MSSWISYSDADANAATQYQFWDGGTGATSGYFWTPDNEHWDASTAITVAASDLGTTSVRGGQVAGSETMYVRAFDGISWKQLGTRSPSPQFCSEGEPAPIGDPKEESSFATSVGCHSTPPRGVPASPRLQCFCDQRANTASLDVLNNSARRSLAFAG